MPKVERETVLKCKVGLGMFKSERTVTVKVDDTEYSAIVDADDVRIAREPVGDELVDGLVRVFVIERGLDKALIDLPRETFTSGTRIIVPLSLLESGRSPKPR
jgi:hypothetical protein